MDVELEFVIYNSVVGFLWLSFAWSQYLDYRQRKIYRTVVTVPPHVSPIMSQETYHKSRLYNLDKSNFGFFKEIFSMIETTVILHFTVIPWLWQICLKNIEDLGFKQENEMIASILFFLYSSLFSFFTSLPWSIYSTFIIEEKHGFNKQTPLFFIKDKIKGLILTFVIGLPVTCGLLAIIKWGGPYFYVYAWFFTFVVMIFFMFVYPNWIAPLFDRYEPLPAGELRTEIEKLAQSIDFPLTQLFVVEGSKRSSHSNAYFYGFWKNKRIVLFDTLLEGFVFPKSDGNETDVKQEKDVEESKKKGCKDHEVLAILGHELGHWKLNHVNFNLLISNVNVFVLFFSFGLLFNYSVFFSAFGFESGSAPIIVRLIVILQFIFLPYNELLNFLMTLLSRKFEFQADAFAVNLGRGKSLASGLVKLLSDNLSFPVNDWLYSAYNFSHPPVLERLEAIKNEDLNVKSKKTN